MNQTFFLDYPEEDRAEATVKEAEKSYREVSFSNLGK